MDREFFNRIGQKRYSKKLILDTIVHSLFNLLMFIKFRRLIAVITLVAVAASAFWAINSEVLFDGMTAEINSAEHYALNVDVNIQNSDHEQSMPGQTCNHGCHAASHLIGLFENTDLGSNTPQLLQTVALGSPNQHDNPFLQGPYRPPLENPLV